MQEEYKGFTITIEQDDLCEGPREWDNLGTMICFHRRYNLGDSHEGVVDNFENNYSIEIDNIRDIENSENVIVLPLYLYDHSGITMNTTGFHCPWDSGQVGFIFVTKGKIKAEYGWKRLTKKRIKQIEEYLRNEVKIYDQYLTRNVYWYDIKEKGKDFDSCGGYYGQDDCLQQAKDVIDCELKHRDVQLELPFVTA